MRPSLAVERRAEMLAAVEACIVEHGIAGLTVQRVADRCGYSRGHVRHYLGNKDDQIRALVESYTERYAASLEDRVRRSPVGERRASVLDELFGASWQQPGRDDDIVLDHLVAYAASHPDSGVSLAPLYDRIAAAVELALADVLAADAARSRARTIVALAYGVSTMSRIGVVTASEVAREARALLELPPDPGA